MIKNLLTALYADDNVHYFNKGSVDFIFSCSYMGILSIDLNNTNLDDTNNNEDDSETSTNVRFLTGYSQSEKNVKHLEKSSTNN